MIKENRYQKKINLKAIFICIDQIVVLDFYMI